jgi:hypothetical protein
VTPEARIRQASLSATVTRRGALGWRISALSRTPRAPRRPQRPAVLGREDSGTQCLGRRARRASGQCVNGVIHRLPTSGRGGDVPRRRMRGRFRTTTAGSPPSVARPKKVPLSTATVPASFLCGPWRFWSDVLDHGVTFVEGWTGHHAPFPIGHTLLLETS